MKKSKMLAGLLLVFMMISSLLAGCSGSSNAPKGSTALTTSHDNKSDKNVELTYWDGTWSQDITPQLIKEFEEKNPNIKIKVEYFPWEGMQDKYLVALKQNSGPDIINLAVDWTIPFTTMGKLQPLDDFITKYKVDMNDFYEGPLKTLTYQGKHYALPHRSEANALYYNKGLFTKAGLDPNKPPATWDELVNISKIIKEKTGAFGFGQSGKEFGNFTAQLFLLIYSNGGSVLNTDNNKSTLLTPESIEAAQFFVDMFRKNKISPDSTMENENTINRNLFANEKVAMFLSGNYDIDAVRKANPNVDFFTSLPPKMKQIKPILGGWNIGVTNTAKNADAAFKFCDFIASKEISPRYSLTFSPRKSAANNEKYKAPELKPFLESLNYAQPMPPIPQWTQIKQIVYSNMQYAMIGEKSVQDSLKEASAEIDNLLAGK